MGDLSGVEVREGMFPPRFAMRFLLSSLAVMLLPLFVTACSERGTGEGSKSEAGETVESAIEADAGSRVEVDDKGVRIRGQGDRKDYSFASGGKVTVPERFPDDVSLYPGAEVRMAQMQLKSDLTITFETPDHRDRVLAFYRDDAAANGWTLLSEATLEDEIFLAYGKERKALTVSADPEGDRTFISISYKVRDF